MAQALIRKIKDDTLEDYRAHARSQGRSLEAELRDLIERNRPKIKMTPQERRAMWDKLAANSMMGTDSLAIIHEARAARFGGLDADN